MTLIPNLSLQVGPLRRSPALLEAPGAAVRTRFSANAPVRGTARKSAHGINGVTRVCSPVRVPLRTYTYPIRKALSLALRRGRGGRAAAGPLLPLEGELVGAPAGAVHAEALGLDLQRGAARREKGRGAEQRVEAAVRGRRLLLVPAGRVVGEQRVLLRREVARVERPRRAEQRCA